MVKKKTPKNRSSVTANSIKTFKMVHINKKKKILKKSDSKKTSAVSEGRLAVSPSPSLSLSTRQTDAVACARETQRSSGEGSLGKRKSR